MKANIARNRRIGYAIRFVSDDGISTLRNGLNGWTWFAFTRRGAERKARRIIRAETWRHSWEEIA
jgi:hypothetical protein